MAACALRNEQAATLLEFMYHSRIVLSVGGSVWYMIRNLRCTVAIDSVLANSKTQNAFLFTVNVISLHDYPLAVEHGSTPRPLAQKKTWRNSLPIDMLLSAVSVLVVAQSSSEIPEGLMNNPVLYSGNMFRSNMAIIRPIIQHSLKILYKLVLKGIDNGDLNSTFTPVATCCSVKFIVI